MSAIPSGIVITASGDATAGSDFSAGPATGKGDAAPPGFGNSFFAGLEELFSNPTAFFQDLTPGGAPANTPAPPTGGNSTLVAGTEELIIAPGQASNDLITGLSDTVNSVTAGIPTWVKWSVVGGIALLALAVVGYSIGEIK